MPRREGHVSKGMFTRDASGPENQRSINLFVSHCADAVWECFSKSAVSVTLLNSPQLSKH